MSGRGQTWSYEEVRCLLDIWSEENISQLLEKVHKNTEVFKIFSEKMKENGFTRTVEQCRVKVKKLRQQYIKVRDALQKSGSSSDVKDKFVWFDDLDKILNTRPVVSPVDIVESYEEGAKSAACTSVSPNQESTSSVDTEMDSRSSSVDEEDSDKSGDPAAGLNKDYGQPRQNDTDQSQQTGKRWAIPGAANRKKRPKTCLDSRLKEYMSEQKKQLDAMIEAEQSHLRHETATFESFLRVQQEAEERRFKALQEQNRENNRMFMQLIGSVMNAVSSQTSRPPQPDWMSLQPQTAYSMPHLPTQSAMFSPPFIRTPLFMPTPPAIQTPSAIPSTPSSSPSSLSTASPRSTPSVNQEPECQQPIPLTVTLEEKNAGPTISFS
ncbi:uncharacterized protein LOC141798294 [Halichoeres trimaculatus]|uniref:uncharacterized protein LOC141787097 n=1 Tax=Halichoeres trimaculatus TaxID=147232 RepID=UPI003D9E52EF